jgi:hypothetical protein
MFIMAELQQWQTLLAAIAMIAVVYIALQNATTRILRQNKELDEQRRARRHAASRSLLPLALTHRVHRVFRRDQGFDHPIDDGIDAVSRWRVRKIVWCNSDPTDDVMIGRGNIVNSIVEAAAIYAEAGEVFGYARRRNAEWGSFSSRAIAEEAPLTEDRQRVFDRHEGAIHESTRIP